MKLLEIVAGADTAPETLARAEALAARRARQGPRARQGHAELHRQPHRHVRHDAHHDRGVEAGLHRRGGRHDLRPADRPPQERGLPHRRRRRPRHPGPRRRELLRRADRRRAARRLRAARRTRRRWSSRSGSATRPSTASTRRQATRSCSSTSKTLEYVPADRSRASPRSAPPTASTTSTSGCAALLAGDDRAADAGPHRHLRDAGLRGQPPRRDRRRRASTSIDAHALGLRLGARPVRDLGRARREGDGREDGGGRLRRSRAGSRSRSPPRARACASTSDGTVAATAPREQLGQRGGFTPVAERPAPDLARRRARQPAARSSATPSASLLRPRRRRRSASSSTPR